MYLLLRIQEASLPQVGLESNMCAQQTNCKLPMTMIKIPLMPITSPPRNISTCMFVIILALSCLKVEGRRRDYDDDMGFDTITDHLWTFLKVGLACSPILIIISMLAFAREDDEIEAAKIEAAKKTKSCKS
jgi:hypothetical protein